MTYFVLSERKTLTQSVNVLCVSWCHVNSQVSRVEQVRSGVNVTSRSVTTCVSTTCRSCLSTCWLLTPRWVHSGDVVRRRSLTPSSPTVSNCRSLFLIPQHTQPFYGPFPGPPGWASARRELLDFMVQGKINRGRHTVRQGTTPSRLTSTHLHHPPYFVQAGCPSCRPTNSIRALKATSTFGLGRRC